MPKEDLARLKQAFFSNNQQEIPPQKNKPQFTISLLITFSISIAVTAFLISYFNKEKVVHLSKSFSGRFVKKEISLSEEIESLFNDVFSNFCHDNEGLSNFT